MRPIALAFDQDRFRGRPHGDGRF